MFTFQVFRQRLFSVRLCGSLVHHKQSAQGSKHCRPFTLLILFCCFPNAPAPLFIVNPLTNYFFTIYNINRDIYQIQYLIRKQQLNLNYNIIMEADRNLERLQDVVVRLQPSTSAQNDRISSIQRIGTQRNIKNQNFDGIIQQLFDFFRKQQSQPNTARSRMSLDDDIMRFQLEYLLRINPRKRTKKDIKNIKTELKTLEYFTKTIYRGQSENSQRLNQLIKRQNSIILQLIAPFATIRHHEQGSIIQETGKERQAMHFLLQGQINLFEPINHTMFRNCIKRADDFQLTRNQQKEQSKLDKREDSNIIMVTQQAEDEDQHAQIKSNCHTAPNSDNSRVKSSKDSTLQSQTRITSAVCHQIIASKGINNKKTKHRLIKLLKSTDLISASNSPTFLKQKSVYELTAVCSTPSYVMEIDYNVAKKICFLVNSDQQKAYTQSLLLKFPELLFNHVQKFVHHDFIMDRRENKYFLSDFIKNSKLLKSQQFLRDQQNYKQSHKRRVDEQQRIQGFSSEINYTGKFYFLMQGQVKLMINKQTKSSVQNKKQHHDLKRRNINFIRRQILCINGPNLFGFQSIGNKEKLNLTYLVNPNCKILELCQSALEENFENCPQFHAHVQIIKNQRNTILQQITQKTANSQKNIGVLENNAFSSQIKGNKSKFDNCIAQNSIQKAVSLTKKYNQFTNCITNNIQRIAIRNAEMKSRKILDFDNNQVGKNKNTNIKLDFLQKQGKLFRIKRQNSLIQVTNGTGKNLTGQMETKSGRIIQFQGEFMIVKSKIGRFERMRRISDFNPNQQQKKHQYFRNENDENTRQCSMKSQAKSLSKSKQKISQRNIGIIYNERMEKYFSQKLIESNFAQQKPNQQVKVLQKQKIRFRNTLKSGKHFISGRGDLQFKNLH